MMRSRWLLVCLALTLMPGVTRADSDDRRYVIEWFAIGNGGGLSRGDGFRIEGTIGQPVLGFSKGSSEFSVSAGFWSPDDFEWDDDDDDDGNVIANTERQGASVAPLSPTGEAPILEFALAPAFPNPSSGVTRIAWAVPVQSHVRLTVHDVQGRLVTTLADAEYQPGRYQVTWNNLQPGGVSPGMYFVRFQSPARTFVRRVTLTH